MAIFTSVGALNVVAAAAVVVVDDVVAVVLLLVPLFDCNRIFCDCHDLTPLFRMVGGPLAAFTEAMAAVPATVAGAMAAGLLAVAEPDIFAVAAATSSFNFAELIKPTCCACDTVNVRVFPPLVVVAAPAVAFVVDFDAIAVGGVAKIRRDPLPLFTTKRVLFALDAVLLPATTGVVGVGAIVFCTETTFLFLICRKLPSSVLINCMAGLVALPGAFVLFAAAAVAF